MGGGGAVVYAPPPPNQSYLKYGSKNRPSPKELKVDKGQERPLIKKPRLENKISWL